jgi:hypothetical protein
MTNIAYVAHPLSPKGARGNAGEMEIEFHFGTEEVRGGRKLRLAQRQE